VALEPLAAVEKTKLGVVLVAIPVPPLAIGNIPVVILPASTLAIF
jgi:hypothetical protein